MFVPYLNCLYAGGKLKRPYFSYHFNNFMRYLVGQKKTPFIAQQECFNYFKNEDLGGIIPYVIPQALEVSYMKKFPSEKEAWEALLKEVQQEYIDWIGECLDKIQMENGEKIEGVLTYIFCPSLYKVCKERKIPVFEFEFSPIRYPTYQCCLGYFMNSNKYSIEESQDRYDSFLRELNSSNISLLSRKEIMAVTFLPKNMYLLHNIDEVEFDLGIALGPEDDSYREVWTSFDNAEIVNMSKKIYGNSTLLRAHPTETKNFDKYNIEIDDSYNSLAFIRRCKRVATICSNVGFESMLLGKPTFVLGALPFSDGAMRLMEMDDDMVCDSKYINFITFCIFTPFELMHNIEYIRWRLTNPSELEIYIRNLQYIIEGILKIDKNIINNSEDRLNRILLARGLLPYHYDKKVTSMTSDEAWVKRQLMMRDKEIFDLEMQIAKLKIER